MFKLKELRLENGQKRSKVAKDLNMNAGTLANYENEIRQAPYDYLVKFANYYEVSIDYLLGNKDNEVPPKQKEQLNAVETQLINDYRKLSDLGKERITEYVDLWLNRREINK